MKKLKYLLILSLLHHILCLSSAFGWNDDITHKDLTDRAVKNSVLFVTKGDYLRSIGFENDVEEVLIWAGKVCDDDTNQTKCGVLDWLKYGAEKEDARKYNLIFNASVRCLNHFHDPIGNKGLSDAGKGISALVWAQDSDSQDGEVEGDQSWSRIRPGQPWHGA